MSKTVKVTYDSTSLQTTITIDDVPFDTSRIQGKSITDWAYPFSFRKVSWGGFYQEMVDAMGGETAFQLIFEGDDAALNELKEAWEDAPVTILSTKENIVTISYDADALSTEITVNDAPFDTARLKGMEIEDWIYPFSMRKTQWNGIYKELASALGSEEYTIHFAGGRKAMLALMDECLETVNILRAGSKAASAGSSTI